MSADPIGLMGGMDPQNGINVEQPVPDPPFPGQTETIIPLDKVDEFDRMATYSHNEENLCS